MTLNLVDSRCYVSCMAYVKHASKRSARAKSKMYFQVLQPNEIFRVFDEKRLHAKVYERFLSICSKSANLSHNFKVGTRLSDYCAQHTSNKRVVLIWIKWIGNKICLRLKIVSYYTSSLQVQKFFKNFAVNEKTAKVQQQKQLRSLSTVVEKHARASPFLHYTSLSANMSALIAPS